MKSQFRLKLSIIMIFFAILISFTIATVDYFKLKEEEIKDSKFQIEQIEETVKYSIETIEKAYSLLGEDISSKMKNSSYYLLDLYRENPNFDQWDFQNLKDLLNFDIYIINDKHVITYSSLPNDIGLDFSVCCRKLVPTLDKRRNSGEFFADGLDIEQHSGKIKKYSYMATADKKYLIQLGFSLQDGTIFQEFNFLKTIEDLVRRYPSVNEINVLNIGGYSLGQPVLPDSKLSSERRNAFEQALSSKKTIEIKGEWQHEPAIYRYVYYASDLDQGTTKSKVLEIVYNQKELLSILSENKKTFIIQLIIVLIATVFLSLILSRWATRFIYLAFHDNLTGLKNRAAFNEILASILRENKGVTALLLIDLDNFKLVNDYLGHSAGDELLRDVANKMKDITSKKDFIFRWGGDEFVVIMPFTSKHQAEQIAISIIEEVHDLCTKKKLNLNGEKITVSIGIALTSKQDTKPDNLQKNADIALYMAKEKGKNQYQFYTAEKEE